MEDAMGQPVRCSMGENAADLAMDRYARGDDAAFAPLYTALSPRLFAYLRRRTQNVCAAEDLLQQTFLQIHRARATYLAGADVGVWATAIARRLVVDALRKSRRQVPLASDDEVAARPPVSRHPRADDLVCTKELALLARRELARLPKSQQTAFDLIRGEELSAGDTALALGATRNAVKLRAHRARVALRDALSAASP
jgi:RNA polymerase sigma-70 factor (ECF subfamily)